MLMGSMFPSAIAVATDGGISLISLVLGQGMKKHIVKAINQHPHTQSIEDTGSLQAILNSKYTNKRIITVLILISIMNSNIWAMPRT